MNRDFSQVLGPMGIHGRFHGNSVKGPPSSSGCQACSRKLDCIRLESLEQHRRVHFTVQRDLLA